MTPVLAAASLALSTGLAGWSFRGIVRGYRRPSGLPWPASIVFAASAAAAVLALHALLAG
ncbi:MAG TPA: hypothetical protein P5119_07240 [Candidatus Aminicenantes bacterium]|nr:hypothetical protein [Candidatus Aminicenantes bacterium]HRY65123.1 hypothetical protein [Candidatus Aminicenantes bacterium]HRZ72409.1 hypothetical protein [Candidatus Aminicenantes bacterium]